MDKPIAEWRCIVSAPFAENTFVVRLAGTATGVIVDPGFEPDAVLAYLTAEGITPLAILNTHGHSDHIAGNAAMKQVFPDVPLIIGEGDAEKLQDPMKNLSAPFGVDLVSPPADQVVREGDELTFGGLTWECWETPGHSAGHVVFLCRQPEPWLLLAGDVLFAGSIGRTDFPDGDHAQLIHVIKTRLFTLPDDTVVLPGHGEVTTIGEEKRSNPFVRIIA